MTEERTIAGYVVYDPVNKVFKKKGSKYWTKNISTCGLYNMGHAKQAAKESKSGFAILTPLYVGDLESEGIPYCKKGNEHLMSGYLFEKALIESD